MLQLSQAHHILFLIFAALATVNAALSDCPKDIALRLTNIYENGNTDFHYEYCENIHDKRGFTAGIAGFCTSTGDAWKVIQEYHMLTGGNDDFSPMDRVLQEYAESGSDSTSGLETYCKVWENLSKTDSKFQQAQDSLRNSLYFNPSQNLADNLGLKFDISRSQMYDAGIQHGTGNDADGLSSLIKYTNAAFQSNSLGGSGSTLAVNGFSVDEILWLQKFIAVRDNNLKHPNMPENQSGEWAKTLYRTRSYSYMVNAKSYKFDISVEALDNDGNRVTVKCANGNFNRR